jgi:phosphatidylglycerol---prolipoprotein diacylglyceryl transferase
MAYIYWNVQPEVLKWGPFAVRWYGLFFALLFWIGFGIVRWQFRVEGKGERTLSSLLTYLVVGTIVGARLGHCLFYEPVYYLQHPIEIPAIWEGGLASHGGATGVLIALYLYCRRHPDQPYLWLLDRIVVPTALGGCFIRLGNLFNSEILGVKTQVPWAFVFPRDDLIPRHPVQLYESLAYLLIFAGLIWLYNRLRARTPRGLLVGLFLVSVFTARLLLEFLKEPQSDFDRNLPLSVGQWLSFPFIGAGLLLLWRTRRSKPAAASVEIPRKA